MGELWVTAIHPQDKPDFWSRWQNCHQQGIPFAVELRFQHADKKTIWVYFQVFLEHDSQGKLIGSVGTATDISSYKQYQHRLNQEVQAKYDADSAITLANQQLKLLVQLDRLTQIPNRQYFEEYLSQEWQRAKDKQLPLSLIFLDIDNFQQINNQYGHVLGDTYLINLAHKITEILKRPRDLVARYGSDEFILLLPDTGLAGAKVVAQSLTQNPHFLEDLPEPITLVAVVSGGIPTGDLIPGHLLHRLKNTRQRQKDNPAELISLALED